MTEERLRALTGGVSSQSAGLDESHERGVTLLAAQVKLQAYTLAYLDGFLIIAWGCVGILILIACMKPMRVYFDARPTESAG